MTKAATKSTNLRDVIDGTAVLEELDAVKREIIELTGKIRALRSPSKAPRTSRQVLAARSLASVATIELQLLKEHKDLLFKLLNKKLPDLKAIELRGGGGKSLEEIFAESAARSLEAAGEKSVPRGH